MYLIMYRLVIIMDLAKVSQIMTGGVPYQNINGVNPIVLIGRSEKGPALIPIKIKSLSQAQAIFYFLSSSHSFSCSWMYESFIIVSLISGMVSCFVDFELNEARAHFFVLPVTKYLS